MKGRFIVFDGNDGSGKATQSKLLAEYLAKEEVAHEKVDFPAYEQNFFGAFVGECLAGKHGDFVHLDPKIASALYALDRLESASHIRDSLVAGKVVIADRFSSSNQIHQGGKISEPSERELFLSWLDKMEHDVLKIPRPDAIIYLRVPLEISLVLLSEKRKAKIQGLDDGQKDTVEEDRNYLERSHESANWLLNNQKNWHLVECVVDGQMRTPQAIHEEVVTLISQL